MNIDTLNVLIRDIYAAANDQEHWDTVVNRIGDELDLGVIHLFLTDLETGTPYIGSSPRGDPDLDRQYQQHYAEQDFRIPRILSIRPGHLFDQRAIVTKEEVARSPIHQDLFPKHDIYEITGAHLSVDNSLGWFGVTTREASGELTSTQLEALRRLSVHFLQAFQIKKTNADLRTISNSGTQALDHIGLGLISLSGGKVLDHNAVASQIFRSGFLSVANGWLICRNPDGNRILNDHLHDKSAAPVLRFRLADPLEGAEFFVVIKKQAALPAVMKPGSQLMLVRRAERAIKAEDTSIADFGEVFGLSKAETDVVQAVVSNIPLAVIAQNKNVKLDTVRKQLKSAMLKLNVASQKEIVSLFMNSI